MMQDRTNISFAGCGFLGLYHVGVAAALHTYAPQIKLGRISGASAGAMAAVALLADLQLGEMTSYVLQIACEARSFALGPFSPSFKINNYIEDGLQRMLPKDIHTKVNGRLHISLTKVYDGTNLLVNQFSSKQEVIDVVIASTFIPIFSGFIPPRYRGTRVIDGGYSDNLPILDAHTITVSPFCGSSDICPQDDNLLHHILQVSVANTSIELSKENLMRMCRVLLPPHPEVLSRYCKQGFEDTLRFLQKRYMISCTRCLAVASTYEVEDEEEEDWETPSEGCKEYDPNCLECKLHRITANQGQVPENVWEVFERAIKEGEGGVFTWLHNINSYRIVRILTFPARLQINIAKGIITRIANLLPTLGDETRAKMEKLMNELIKYVGNGGVVLKENYHLAKYTCEFNITQYGEDSMTDLTQYSEKERKESVKDILNLGFTAHLESETSPDLPHTVAEAHQFQNENLSAAVVGSSKMGTRVGSLAGSRMASLVTSRVCSRVGSRMGSRTGSMNSLHNIDGELPETLGNIKTVTETQDAVMSFYYTDSSNTVKVMEIFDVTQTDPSLLVTDTMGIEYSEDQVIHHDRVSRLRHSSGPAAVQNSHSLSRRSSLTSAGRARHHSSQPSDTKSLRFPMEGLKSGPRFAVGDGDSDDDDETKRDYFSDPESEESENKLKMQRHVKTSLT